jgi:hypothetical protein
MAVEINESAFIVPSSQSIALSQMVSTTASASDPAYLVLTGLDRDEYTAGATGATGTFSGGGYTAGFRAEGGDARGAGLVFAYQASTGRYYNSAFGYLDQLTYTASGSLGDVTNLSLFGTNTLQLAMRYGSDASAMMQLDPAGYLGSATVATQPGFAGAVPAQATPDSIAAVADSFVGRAWNLDGCWVLASTIAAEAGASLPVQSTAIGVPGAANGEWYVAYDGPAGQTGDWQGAVSAGDMVAFETGSGGGHITTCVAGAGSTAMLVDNITYVNASGAILNGAGDGSANDVIVASPHAASEEWSGVPASSVVIYALDTPVVTADVAGLTVAAGGSASLGGLFSAADPEGKAVTAYQVYDPDLVDSVVVDGTAEAAHSAATAALATSLSQVVLDAGAASDTLYVRASNGAYWGDWTALGVSVTGGAAGSNLAGPNFSWTDAATGATGSGAGTAYAGPVSGLQWQDLWPGQDGVALAAHVADVFLQGGPGDDALTAYAGSNVLDGGTGSNFLVGATGADGGADTFFLDGRGNASTWDTLVNVHLGDGVTLWGFVPGQGTIAWAGAEGAAGYQGATLHASFPGTGAEDSITFAGLSLADAWSKLTVSTGTAGGVPYLYVKEAG